MGTHDITTVTHPGLQLQFLCSHDGKGKGGGIRIMMPCSSVDTVCDNVSVPHTAFIFRIR